MADVLADSVADFGGLTGGSSLGRKKKPINRKHINIFLAALVGQSSQGRTPTRPRDKRDKMAILLLLRGKLAPLQLDLYHLELSTDMVAQDLPA